MTEEGRKVWVRRNGEGRVVGIFTLYQESIETEAVPENHPDVVAYEEEQKEAMRLVFAKA